MLNNCMFQEHYKLILMKVCKLKKQAMSKIIDFNHFTHYLFLSVCRLSSGSVCNVLGTYNCSTSQCYCKSEYEGELCEKCKWREFSFVSSQRINGTIDPINGYGVTCKKGILYQFET